MAIDVEWINDAHTAMLLTFDAEWTWNDFERATDRSFMQIAGVEHSVDIITVNKTSSKPPDTQLFSHFQRFWVTRPDNLRRVLVVGANAFMVKMSETFSTVFVGKRKVVEFVETLEDALALVSEADAEGENA